MQAMICDNYLHINIFHVKNNQLTAANRPINSEVTFPPYYAEIQVSHLFSLHAHLNNIPNHSLNNIQNHPKCCAFVRSQQC